MSKSVPKNSVFIATSIDGYIADKNGQIDWLNIVPNPDQEDMGYTKFISDIDALVMGRTTFETVCGFDVDWPYDKPVFVLSNTLQKIPESHQQKAFLCKGSPKEIIEQIHGKGHYHLYIDGGKTIQNFLKEDLVDEMIITTIPIMLGGGFSLFHELTDSMRFELIDHKVFLNQVTQSHYRRLRLE